MVKDVRDTVTTGRKIGEEARKTRDAALYNDTTQLTRDQVYQLQSALNSDGYDAGVADGQMGGKTRRAIAAYQSDNGLYADGSVSYEVFSSIVGGRDNNYRASTPLSRNEWQEFQSMLNQMGFDAGTPDGKPGPRTKRAVEAFKRSRNLGPSSAERAVFSAAREAADRSTTVGLSNGGNNLNRQGSQSDNATVQTTNQATTQFTGPGALYRQMMSAWLNSSQRTNLPEEVQSAAYVYAFEDHERQGEYCKSLETSGSALQASDQLADMVRRYQQFQQHSALNKTPVQLSYTLSSRNPYDNYDIDKGELVLRGHQWGKRVNLADGRTGQEYTPCSNALSLIHI